MQITRFHQAITRRKLSYLTMTIGQYAFSSWGTSSPAVGRHFLPPNAGGLGGRPFAEEATSRPPENALGTDLSTVTRDGKVERSVAVDTTAVSEEEGDGRLER